MQFHLQFLVIRLNHVCDQLIQSNLGLPSQQFLSLGGVRLQKVDFGGAVISGINPDDDLAGLLVLTDLLVSLSFPNQLNSLLGKSQHHKLSHGILNSCTDNEIIWLILLQHQPHGLNIFLSMSPISPGIQITHVQAVLSTSGDSHHTSGDLSGHKGGTSPGALVIEQDTVGTMESVGFTVVDDNPVGEDLGASIRRARVEGGFFSLRDFSNITKHFRSGSLVKSAGLD
mmetsp:Transcript_35635/g.55613  ORF Transcript_35635/g.55613 Transcript_35635/m.55613 type:complete len:228 (-) Transcript_35635:599-1282(-)